MTVEVERDSFQETCIGLIDLVNIEFSSDRASQATIGNELCSAIKASTDQDKIIKAIQLIHLFARMRMNEWTTSLLNQVVVIIQENPNLEKRTFYLKVTAIFYARIGNVEQATEILNLLPIKDKIDAYIEAAYHKNDLNLLNQVWENIYLVTRNSCKKQIKAKIIKTYIDILERMKENGETLQEEDFLLLATYAKSFKIEDTSLQKHVIKILCEFGYYTQAMGFADSLSSPINKIHALLLIAELHGKKLQNQNNFLAFVLEETKRLTENLGIIHTCQKRDFLTKIEDLCLRYSIFHI